MRTTILNLMMGRSDDNRTQKFSNYVHIKKMRTKNKVALAVELSICLITLIYILRLYISLVMRKPVFGICENKDADQLCGNRTADRRLCFRYTDGTIPLLSKSDTSSL